MAEFEEDLGEDLYEALKPYIIPEQDLKFQKEALGEGFFGVVRKAEHIPKRKQYASKFLKGNPIMSYFSCICPCRTLTFTKPF